MKPPDGPAKPMRAQRTGTVDPFKRPDGSVYYRGRIRLGDGSLHRLTIEEPFCNVEADARKYTATTQAEEDAHGRRDRIQTRGAILEQPIATLQCCAESRAIACLELG